MKHAGEIKTLSLSPDSLRCVTGATNYQSAERTALIWDVSSLSVVGELKGHDSAIYSSAWSPAGRIIATGGSDNVVRLWDAKSCAQVGELGHDLFLVRALAFSPDERFLLTGSANNAPTAPVHDDSCFRIWDVRRRKELGRLGVHKSSVQSVAFSRDGRIAACGSTGQFTSSGPSDEGRVFCPQTLRLWNLTPGIFALRTSERFIDTLEHTAWVNSVRFFPDSEHFFTAGSGCFVWNLSSGRIVRQFKADNFEYANCGDLSLDGRYIATGSGGQDEPGAPYKDCFVRVWQSMTGHEIARFKHEYPVTALAFSPMDGIIVAGGHHGELRTWKLPQLVNDSLPKSAETPTIS